MTALPGITVGPDGKIIKTDPWMKKIKMPNSIEDLLAGDNYYVGMKWDGNRSSRSYGWNPTPESLKIADFVNAIRKGDLEAIQKMERSILMKYLNSSVLFGADGNFTPLMLAAIVGKTDIMRYLIELGADIMLKNKGEYTATDYLKHYKMLQDKKRADELKKQQEKDEVQRQKDELNVLMDEVDGKKPPKTKDVPVKVDGPRIGNSRKFDEILKEEVDEYKNKQKKVRQIGNGKGIDDKLAKATKSNERNTLKTTENKDRWGKVLPPGVRDI